MRAIGLEAADLTRRIDAVLALPEPPECRDELADERRRLLDGRLNVVVVGHFKRGKSTLLNALLGRRVLPTGVVPVTSVVTLVRAGAADGARVFLNNGQEERMPLDAIASCVAEKENPANEKGVERVEVEMAGTLLAPSIVLADTPGSGSAFLHNTETLKAWLGHIDAGIFVVSADPPVGAGELEFMGEVRDQAGEVVVVLNKTDRLDPGELDEALDYTRNAVEAVLGKDVVIVPCSAKQGLDRGWDGTGVDQVASWLQGLQKDRGKDVLLRGVARRVGRLLSHELAIADIEAAAAKRGSEELRDTLEHARVITGELETSKEEALAIFDRGCRLIMAQYDDASRTFLPDVTARLLDTLNAEADRLRGGRASVLRFKRELESTRDREALTLLRPFQREREAAVIEGFEALSGRTLGHVNRLVDEAFSRVAELLGVTVHRFDVTEGFTMESRLTYRMGLPRANLDYLLEGATFLLPPPLARRVFLRRQLKYLPRAMDLQMGRIRADLHQRLNETAISFRANLSRRAQEALSRIQTALQRSDDLVSGDRSRLAERMEALNGRREALSAAIETCRF
ncbi:MAG: hypothetical protein GXP54_05895 [Deltaproteobacteria bacterium]|nr:hypothetical protein [Deltaproteobacteria bacterium]